MLSPSTVLAWAANPLQHADDVDVGLVLDAMLFPVAGLTGLPACRRMCTSNSATCASPLHAHRRVTRETNVRWCWLA